MHVKSNEPELQQRRNFIRLPAMLSQLGPVAVTVREAFVAAQERGHYRRKIARQ